ncbi:hypothetical protein HKW98_12535 [Stutzerimonas urumqiensis]
MGRITASFGGGLGGCDRAAGAERLHIRIASEARGRMIYGVALPGHAP